MLSDGHANALSFFSEAGFRYFLPAYLISDLRGQLRRQTPVPSDARLLRLDHQVPPGTVPSLFKHGRSRSSPRRYGAMTSTTTRAGACRSSPEKRQRHSSLLEVQERSRPIRHRQNGYRLSP